MPRIRTKAEQLQEYALHTDLEHEPKLAIQQQLLEAVVLINYLLPFYEMYLHAQGMPVVSEEEGGVVDVVEKPPVARFLGQ